MHKSFLCKYLYVFLIFCGLLASPLLAEIPFIVDGNATNSFIVTDLDPVPAAQFAARELAEYLEKGIVK